MPFDNDLATPFFSIVIPCYNRPEELRRTLQSCLEQDYPDFEAIVVDDGSQEDMASVVESFGDPRLRYLRQANAGACAARNRGMNAARGAWIALLDSDDTFTPNKLAICLEVILRETQTRDGAPDLLFHKIEIDRGAERKWTQPERMPRPGETMAEFLFCAHQHIMTSTLVVRAEVARLVRFDESLPMNQDVDFKVRLAAMGYRAQGIDQVLGWYDDVGSVGRVSRGKHLARLTAWIEEARPWMSEKAYWAYRTNMLSPHRAPVEPLATLGDFWRGLTRGGVPLKTVLRRMIRAYAPGLYGKLTILWMNRFGH